MKITKIKTLNVDTPQGRSGSLNKESCYVFNYQTTGRDCISPYFNRTEIFGKSSLDLAMRDAYHKMRHFLRTAKNLNEDEAISLMSVAVDFGITQVVDGNWGIHASVKKNIFL